MKYYRCFILIILLQSNFGLAATTHLERVPLLMGSQLQLNLSTEKNKDLSKISEEMILQLNVLEQKISTWKNDSEFSRFNQATPGTQFKFSEDIKPILDAAYQCHDLTQGFFHPGLGKLVEAWGIRKQGAIPSESTFNELFNSSQISNLKITKNTYSKSAASFYLEEGGFAKGAALDKAKSIAIKNGLKEFYFNFSGQIMASKKTAVSIADPNQRLQESVSLILENSSLSTTSNSVQKFNIGKKSFGHILNPKTGKPLELFDRSLSVIHASGAMADCLSTGLFAMSSEQETFNKWIKAHPEIKFIKIDSLNGKLLVQASCNLKNQIIKKDITTLINYECEK